MPITRLQFDLGIDADIEERMRKLATFFEEHREEAYSLQELWQQEFDALPPKSWQNPHAPVGEPRLFSDLSTEAWQDDDLPEQQRRLLYALDRLVSHGVVSERVLAGLYYYSAGRVQLTQVLKS